MDKNEYVDVGLILNSFPVNHFTPSHSGPEYLKIWPKIDFMK